MHITIAYIVRIRPSAAFFQCWASINSALDIYSRGGRSFLINFIRFIQLKRGEKRGEGKDILLIFNGAFVVSSLVKLPCYFSLSDGALMSRSI